MRSQILLLKYLMVLHNLVIESYLHFEYKEITSQHVCVHKYHIGLTNSLGEPSPWANQLLTISICKLYFFEVDAVLTKEVLTDC